MKDRFKFRGYHPVIGEVMDISEIDYHERIAYFIDGDGFNIDEIKFMQCTGLKDRNGTLIYEGDIVHFYGDEFLQTKKIIWDNDELDFKAIGLKKSVECYEKDFSYLGYIKKEDSLEVIGNIYENPELLEVENESKM